MFSTKAGEEMARRHAGEAERLNLARQVRQDYAAVCYSTPAVSLSSSAAKHSFAAYIHRISDIESVLVVILPD